MKTIYMYIAVFEKSSWTAPNEVQIFTTFGIGEDRELVEFRCHKDAVRAWPSNKGWSERTTSIFPVPDAMIQEIIEDRTA